MADIPKIVAAVRKVCDSGRAKDLSWRKSQMKAMINMLDQEKESFRRALKKDLNKHSHESDMMEIGMVRNEAVSMLDNIDQYAAPQKVPKNLLTMSDTVYIRPEPFGMGLIIGAWNYPVQLTLLPLLGAIAAGNCAILKPSELAEATAKLLEELVPKYLDNEAIKVINGAVPETSALLKERFDMIFYTGNSQVAKIVYEAAAKHLTPVTLELGGKSPVYVDPSSDMDIAARRILWGRFVNAGQTCIAPDYIMCSKSVESKLVERMKAAMTEFYPDAKGTDSYGRIINNRHFKRLSSLMGSGRIVIGGNTDEADLYIEPTVMVDVKATDPVMQQEIFGPLLPIMTVQDEDEAIQFMNSREKPLAMYLFSNNQTVTDKLISSTSSGGLTVNDTVMHAALDTLPFGGVGCSGMGSYHGKFGFDQWSHHRACMVRPQGMEFVNALRYPPYTEKKSNMIAWVMNKKPKRKGIMSYFPIMLVGVVIAFVLRQLGFDINKYLPISR